MNNDLNMIESNVEAIHKLRVDSDRKRRMNAVERRHSDLDLQMSLLVEQEVTKIARATFLIAQKLGVASSATIDLEKAGYEVRPSDVLEKILDVENNTPTHLTNDNLAKKN